MILEESREVIPLMENMINQIENQQELMAEMYQEMEQRDGQLPGRCPGYGNRQKYPRPTNGGRRKELRTRKRKCRKSMGQPFGENLGQYRVPQPHARNESKREKHLRHVTYLEVNKKGFQ